MKLKKSDLTNAEPTILKILKTPIAFKLAYRLNKIIGKISKDLFDLEQERRILINKYGVRDEKADRTQVPPENMEVFSKEFAEILEKEIDIDIQLIPFDLLVATEIKLSAAEVNALANFVAEPVEPTFLEKN